METYQAEIAAVAARLIVEEGLDYGAANRRAVKQLGAGGRGGLPDKQEVEAAVEEYIALFCADTQPHELRALRELALQWMQRLARFKPHLGGAVWRGTATRRSDIYLQLFCEDPKAAEIALIRHGAGVADVGGFAIREAVTAGLREIDIAMAGRDAMELEIAKRFPDAEYRDTWVWFQSGINTDGAHNPVTSRKLQRGDILSLNTFPMISGYYTALERTMFVQEVDAASRRIWDINVAAHEYGMSLLVPGAKCSDVTAKLNTFFEEHQVLQYRTFGYGHSFGVLSHYYGREAGLELREDIDTVLEPGMVISMEPMLTIPEGQPGAGGYREHDILIITEDGNEDITKYPYGPEFNIVG